MCFGSTVQYSVHSKKKPFLNLFVFRPTEAIGGQRPLSWRMGGGPGGQPLVPNLSVQSESAFIYLLVSATF